MSIVVNIGPNRFTLLLRAVLICLFGTVVFWMLSVVHWGASGEVFALLIVSVLATLLIVFPAVRGYLNWPYRVQFDGNKLMTHTLLFGRSLTNITGIRSMQKTSYWHGGRALFNGLVLHLTSGRRIILSEGNLGPVDALRAELLKWGIPEQVPR